MEVMHPGWAAIPGVTQSSPTFNIMRPTLRDRDAGADTTTWLLASEPAPFEGGLWMVRRERPRPSSDARLGPRLNQRQRMWQGSPQGRGSREFEAR